MTWYINAGTGPVADATEAFAVKAMQQFALDTKAESFARRHKRHDSDGYYSFHIYRRNKRGKLRKHVVEMPGLPLEKLRWMDLPTQNIWHFQRLYIDGSSWVWFYAINRVIDDDDDDDEDDSESQE